MIILNELKSEFISKENWLRVSFLIVRLFNVD